MSRYGTICLVILFLLSEFFILKYYSTKEDNIIEKITELESQISNIDKKKDSIIILVDTIENRIVTNNNYYEKRVEDIITQSPDSNALFVGQYLRRFCKSNGFIMQ